MNTDTEAELRLATAISGLLSLLRSAVITASGAEPVV